jgi:hypothetical protein
VSKGRHIHKRKEGMCPFTWRPYVGAYKSQCEAERGHQGDHYDAEGNVASNRGAGK